MAVAFGFFVADFFLLLVALFVVFFGVAAFFSAWSGFMVVFVTVFFFDTRDPINDTTCWRREKRPILDRSRIEDSCEDLRRETATGFCAICHVSV